MWMIRGKRFRVGYLGDPTPVFGWNKEFMLKLQEKSKEQKDLQSGIN